MINEEMKIIKEIFLNNFSFRRAPFVIYKIVKKINIYDKIRKEKNIFLIIENISLVIVSNSIFLDIIYIIFNLIICILLLFVCNLMSLPN